MVQDDIPKIDLERYRIGVRVHVAAGRPGIPNMARRELKERVTGNARLGPRWWAEHEAEIRQLWRRVEQEAGVLLVPRAGAGRYEEAAELEAA